MFIDEPEPHVNYPADNIAGYLVVALCALPFPQIFTFSMGPGIVDAQEAILLLLMALLSSLFLTRFFRPICLLPLCLFSAIVILQIVYVLLCESFNFLTALNQLRKYLPFFVATLLLVVPLRISPFGLIRRMLLAGFIAALTAAYIHFLKPELLISLLPASSDVVEIAIKHGRLYWTGSLIIYLAIASSSFAWISPSLKLFYLIIIGFVTLCTVNRTVVLGAFVLLFVLVIQRKTVKERMKYFLTIGIGFALIGAVLLTAITFDARLSNMYMKRYLGYGDLSNIIEESIIENRVPLYKQYFNILNESWISGQGLGKPIAYNAKTRQNVFTTDISVLSMFIPFGIVGLLCIILFVGILWVELGKCKNSAAIIVEICISLQSVLAILILVSLNIDVFTRNSAVVWLTALVSSMRSCPTYYSGIE